MPRSFATTDKVAIAAAARPAAMSILFWAKTPIITAQAVAFHWSSSTTGLRVAFQTNGKLRFVRSFSGTDGQWDITPPSILGWHHYAVCYDGADVANDPVIYVDTIPQAITEVGTPVGTVSTSSSGAPTWGNENGGTLPVGGSLARCSLHDVMLDETEVLTHQALGFLNRGRYADLWMESGASEIDYSGNGRAGTVTGTTLVNDGPPIRLPSSGAHPFSESVAVPAAPPPPADPPPIPDEEEPPVDPPPPDPDTPPDEELPDPTPLPPILDGVVLAIADLRAVRAEKVIALDAAVAGVSRLERDRAASDISFTDQTIRELVRAQNLITRLGI